MHHLLLIALCVFFSTFLGGLFALKFKDKLHLILGFSAGAVIGVAFFDLLPEALSLGSQVYSLPTITALVALGFAGYMILDRFVILHTALDHDGHEARSPRGILGAGSLSIHSFLDGVAIGIAFQVSMTVGIVVTLAVLMHDFSDGINTVNMILKNQGNKKQAFKWLFIDAIAPVLGIGSTFFFSLPEEKLAVILAIFSGFFLYIGASDLLPESHHQHPAIWTTLMTLLGMLLLFTVVRIGNL